MRVLLIAAGALAVCAVAAPTAFAAPPSNDNFASGTNLGATFNTPGATIEATGQVGEPNHAGVSYFDPDPSVCPFDGGTFEPLCQSSVWYAWTAPSTGTFRFQTCSSNFDTVLAVYTGNAVNALTAIASNDDTACGSNPFASVVSFSATSTVVYRIAVAGAFADEGNFTLSTNAPPPFTGGPPAVTPGPTLAPPPSPKKPKSGKGNGKGKAKKKCGKKGKGGKGQGKNRATASKKKCGKKGGNKGGKGGK